MVMRAHLLGQARVVIDDRAAVWLKPTMRDQTLAFLACSDGWVPRDRIAFLFWADVPQQTARHNVRQLLKRVHQLPWLDRLDIEDDWVRWPVPTDLADLRAAIAAQRWQALPADATLLPALEHHATVEYEDWLLGERRRVHELWRSALLAGSANAEAAGAPARAARLLEPLLDDDDGDHVLAPYMRLMTRAGDRAVAVTAFERVATRLREDLGIEPPRQVRELADRIRSDPTGRVEPPRLVVGRDDEATEITRLMAMPHCRLLTLLGPGGIGKSTLARMVLGRMATRFTDGAVPVSLETIADASTIPSRIAAELGVGLDGRLDPFDQIARTVRDRNLMLVLDNAEHLPDGLLMIPRLLRQCPRLFFLVTSRERLGLDDEWVYQVGGLPDVAGVELLRERARRVAPGNAVTSTDALAVCRAVGGSPLGIELAAPWLRIMPAAEIAEEIGRDLSILSGGARDAAGRHRSIEAAMAHSWRLTTPEERATIEALSVFAAPYTRALAGSVVDVYPPVLRGLVDKSLVHRRSDGRYVSHPLVRQYAAARLAADADRQREIRDRHCRAVLGALDSPGAAEERVDLLDDAVAAWQHAVGGAELDLVRRSVDGLITLLHGAGRYAHSLGLLSLALTALEGRDPATTAALKYGESRALDRLGRHREAADAARVAVAAAGNADSPHLRVRALLALAWASKTIEGDSAQHAVTTTALPIAQSLSDDLLLAQVYNSLGCSARTLSECREHLERGLGIATEADLPAIRAVLLNNLGGVCLGVGDSTAGVHHMREALAVARSQGGLPLLVECLADLAFAYADLGELDQAEVFSAEAEALVQDTEYIDQKIYVLLVAGEIRRLAGDGDGASARLNDALRLAESVGHEAFLLRSLRLGGQLLIDHGRIDEGLGMLAFVMAGPTRRGDFVSEVINPRVWAEHTAGVDPRRVRNARQWAREHSLAVAVSGLLAANDRPGGTDSPGRTLTCPPGWAGPGRRGT